MSMQVPLMNQLEKMVTSPRILMNLITILVMILFQVKMMIATLDLTLFKMMTCIVLFVKMMTYFVGLFKMLMICCAIQDAYQD